LGPIHCYNLESASGKPPQKCRFAWKATRFSLTRDRAGDVAGKRRGSRARRPRADGSRLRTPGPRPARPFCTEHVPPCRSLLAVNRHRASPQLEARREATTPRRPEMRARTITAIVVLGAAVTAAGASANFRSVDDPRGDTGCKSESGSCSDSHERKADIVRATAGHGKNGRLKHTIRVVGKLHGASIDFNTDLSNRRAEWASDCHRRGKRHTRIRGDDPTMSMGRARCDFHRHSVEISFSKSSIGNPHRYGWRVFVTSGGVTDVVPRREDYIQHRLG